MNDPRLLDRLMAEQARYAVEALRNPGGKSEFDFGHRTGVIAGLEKAIGLLLELLDEERNGNNDI